LKKLGEMTRAESEAPIRITMMTDPLPLREPFQKHRLHAQLLGRLFNHEELALGFACHVACSRHGNKLVSAEGGHPPPAPGKSRPIT
jgi:hypothetical protein